MKNKIALGKKVNWSDHFHDGRSYEVIKHTGVITKVNRVTVDIFDENKNIVRINKLRLM
jgi:transposase